MKEKAKELIALSQAMNTPQKALYLKLIDLISEQELIAFIAILEQEQSKIIELKTKSEHETSEINKSYLAKIDQVFKVGRDVAVKEEEAEDLQKGEDLLKQLEDL